MYITDPMIDVKEELKFKITWSWLLSIEIHSFFFFLPITILHHLLN